MSKAKIGPTQTVNDVSALFFLKILFMIVGLGIGVYNYVFKKPVDLSRTISPILIIACAIFFIIVFILGLSISDRSSRDILVKRKKDGADPLEEPACQIDYFPVKMRNSLRYVNATIDVLFLVVFYCFFELKPFFIKHVVNKVSTVINSVICIIIILTFIGRWLKIDCLRNWLGFSGFLGDKKQIKYITLPFSSTGNVFGLGIFRFLLVAGYLFLFPCLWGLKSNKLRFLNLALCLCFLFWIIFYSFRFYGESYNGLIQIEDLKQDTSFHFSTLLGEDFQNIETKKAFKDCLKTLGVFDKTLIVNHIRNTEKLFDIVKKEPPLVWIKSKNAFLASMNQLIGYGVGGYLFVFYIVLFTLMIKEKSRLRLKRSAEDGEKIKLLGFPVRKKKRTRLLGRSIKKGKRKKKVD